MSRAITRRSMTAAILAAPVASPIFASQLSETMPWIPVECAPRLFPMRTINGRILLADGSVLELQRWRDLNNGWGKPGAKVADMDTRAMPVALDMVWFSYAENTAYQTKLALPALVKDYLSSKKVTLRDHAKQVPLDRLIIGYGPSGFLSVWLAGGGEVVLVASATGRTYDIAWDEISQGRKLRRDQYVEEVLKERLTPAEIVQMHQVLKPSELFENYHRRYAWTPKILEHPGQPYSVDIRSFNGEDARITPFAGPEIEAKTRPVPREIDYSWTAPDRKEWRLVATFHEAEIFDAFRKVTGGNTEMPFRINLELKGDGATLSVESKNTLIPLAGTATRVTPIQ